MNYSVRIDLAKLQGATLMNIKGKTATKRCLLIPVDDADLFVGEKGVYLDAVAWEQREQKYDSTHCVKQSFPKSKMDAMTEEQRRQLPILGSLKPMQQQGGMQPSDTYEATTIAENADDLPF